MVRLRLFGILLLLSNGIALAQDQPSFKPLRYNEDYSYLAKDSSRTFYEGLKYIPFSKQKSDSYLSVGGEARGQYFYIQNEDWGDSENDGDGYLLSRFLLHTDWRFSKNVRAFVQVQSSLASSRPITTPVEENPLDLHQAFVDVSAFDTDHTSMTFRVGRQELSYGSQRLISVRENPNNRQAFDAAKIMYKTKDVNLDLFYSHYVLAKKGVFDDGFNKDTRLWGAYSTFKSVPVLGGIDAYYLGFYKKSALFADVNGRELRHSVGSRVFGGLDSWNYDIEGLVQFGKLGSSKILAWTASINTTYSFDDVFLKPEIGLKAEFISGDQGEKDRVGSFNALYPKGAYFGLAALIGPSNLAEFHPSINFQLAKDLEFSVDYDFFWRYSKADGIYGVNMVQIYDDGGSQNRHIGNQLIGALLYSPNRFLTFRGEFTWFQAGDYIKDVSAGKDIYISGLTAQVKF